MSDYLNTGVRTIRQFAEALIPTEGGPGDLNYRNNNPGNLKDSNTGAFRVFATWDEGFQALMDDLAAKVRKYPDFTILQSMQRYLGMNPYGAVTKTNQGDALAKAQAVADRLGVSVNDTLRKVFGNGVVQ